MKISIIIPVYKDPEGLKTTLDSLNKQTTSFENYEIVVCNDGSDKEVDKVCSLFSNVRVVRTKPNKGSYGARNEAIKISKGKYLGFVDADIKVSKNWIERGYNSLQKYDYVGGRVDIDKAKLKTLADYYEYLTAFNNERNMMERNFCPTANIFIKRAIIDDLGMFDERLKSGGDVEFGNRIYDSKKYKMYYDDNLRVIHPSRGYKALVKKNIRITKGRMDLYRYYPERYKQLSIKTFFAKLVLPFYEVLRSKRNIPFDKKIGVLVFSLYLGFVNGMNFCKVKTAKE